jgi:4-diphosphocytidyl-2-C-methyl-D-erythritol kinase
MSEPSGWTGRAPAKVNLLLRVLAREEDGYHQIETLFQALELADRLTLTPADPGTVTLEVAGVPDGALGPDDENLAVRAALAYRERIRTLGVEPVGVRIRLEKEVPHGAGLGGGSSDAAAVLRGMEALHGNPLGTELLVHLAGGLGADVPFFLSPSPLALGWGRGDQLLALPPLPAREVILAVPREGIGTPWAYRTLAQHRAAGEVRPPGSVLYRLEDLGSWEALIRLAENAFEEALFPGRPELRRIRDRLRGLGAAPALLSGSGSAVFGIFSDPEAASTAEATESLEREFEGLRVIRTRTRSRV